MVHRRGLGRGRGKGYYNLVPRDSYIHGLSARGILSARYVPFKHKGKRYSLEKVKAINVDGSPFLRGFVWREGQIGSWKTMRDTPYRVQGDEEQELLSLVEESLDEGEIVFNAKGLNATYIFQARDDVGKQKKFKTWDFKPKMLDTFVAEGKRYKVTGEPAKKKGIFSPYPRVHEINFQIKDVESFEKLDKVDTEIFDIIDEDYASCVTGSSARDSLVIPDTKSELDGLIKKIEKKKGLLK